jgi:hypothetical protein
MNYESVTLVEHASVKGESNVSTVQGESKLVWVLRLIMPVRRPMLLM